MIPSGGSTQIKKSMQIKNINIPHGLCLAPMAGVTDHAFRVLCREMGAEYMVSEMISAKAVHYRNRKTDELAIITDEERPMAIQLFGSEPDIMAQSAQNLLARFSPDAIDINMGCPVRKVTSNGEGSALMRTPELAYEIIRAVSSAVSVPVTVKLRSGWDESEKNAPYLAELAEKAGAAAVTIHGRTREQLYRPPSDNGIIAEVKRAVSIPVIGNGGINSSSDMLKMFEETRCDGVMLARGTEGNPWLFAECAAALDGREYTPPDREEILSVLGRHIRALIADKGERIGVAESRKHIAWYIKGMAGAAQLRDKINFAHTAGELLSLIGACGED